MKKMIALLLTAVCLVSLAACGAEEKEVPPQMEAMIVDTDPDNRSITVEDLPGAERIFGRKTLVDCEDAPVYHEGDTGAEISFLDLETGDRIRLTLGDKARKDLGKGKTEISALQVEILR